MLFARSGSQEYPGDLVVGGRLVCRRANGRIAVADLVVTSVVAGRRHLDRLRVSERRSCWFAGVGRHDGPDTAVGRVASRVVVCLVDAAASERSVLDDLLV